MSLCILMICTYVYICSLKESLKDLLKELRKYTCIPNAYSLTERITQRIAEGINEVYLNSAGIFTY